MIVFIKVLEKCYFVDILRLQNINLEFSYSRTLPNGRLRAKHTLIMMVSLPGLHTAKSRMKARPPDLHIALLRKTAQTA